MTGTEYLLLALVILIPAAIAIVVTLWSLEQARLRSAKNRKGVRKVSSRPAAPEGDSAAPRSDGEAATKSS